MYCTECGKKNPDGARFCAFCGAVLASPKQSGVRREREKPDAGMLSDDLPKSRAERRKEEEAGQEPPFEVEPDAIVPTAPPKPPRTQAKRPPVDPSRIVRPSLENPAQPSRTPVENTEKYARPRPLRDTSLGALKQPIRAPKSEPTPIPASEDEKPTAADKPSLRHRPAGGNVITSGGSREDAPGRKPPIKKSYKRTGYSPNTHVPERERQRKIDLFYEDGDDELIDTPEHPIRRRVVSLVASVVVLAIFSSIFWLLFMPGGRIFRASIGVSAPADAYKAYGDQLRNEGRIVEAAAAYYNALKLDPKNFQYAMLTAQTKEIVGDYELAERAYVLCIELNERSVEAYRLLAGMYDKQGKSEQRIHILELGVQATQNEELKQALSQVKPEGSSEPIAPAQP